MKLCLIAPIAPPYGGVSNWEKIIVSEIKKHPEIDLSQINIAANKRPTDGRNIFDRIFYSGHVMLRAYWKLASLIKTNKPDIVHMTTSGGLGFIRDLLILKCLKRKKIPVIYHIHFGRGPQFLESNSWQWKLLLKSMELATRVIVIDQQSFNTIIKFINKNKVMMVANPIDVEKFNAYQVEEVSDVVYLGWVIKEKGIEELLSAINMANIDEEKKMTLKIIGPIKKEYLLYLKTKYDLSHVRFLGEKSHDIAMQELSKAKILVLPSYTEGFPNVILEAMILEKSIIATAVGAIPEMLSGECGILIDKKNIKELKNALTTLYSNKSLRQKLSKNAKIKVNSQYNVKAVFDKYFEIWSSIL